MRAGQMLKKMQKALLLLSLLLPATTWGAADMAKPLFLAHGGGAYGDQTVTNSLEALEANYAKGFRCFEIDFSWTADGALAAIHDWDGTVARYYPGLSQGIAPTRAEFLQTRMKGGLTPLDLAGVVTWVQKHPDVLVVTDVKENNLQAMREFFSKDPLWREVVIPQAYSYQEYDEIKALGFSRIILTLYRMETNYPELMQFAISERPYAITIEDKILLKWPLAEELSKLGITVYSHTVNDFAGFFALQKKGVAGIYTDVISPP